MGVLGSEYQLRLNAHRRSLDNALSCRSYGQVITTGKWQLLNTMHGPASVAQCLEDMHNEDIPDVNFNTTSPLPDLNRNVLVGTTKSLQKQPTPSPADL
jgi:hypothetical protein